MTTTTKTILPGHIFTWLTVIKETDRVRGISGRSYRVFECSCRCGSRKTYRLEKLLKRETNSCGCFVIDKNTTHGLSDHPLFGIYKGIVARTCSPKSISYKHYGARGIENKFGSIENFVKEMYPTYKEGLQLDRINNDGHYEASNCRWVTTSQNCRNKSNNRTIEYDGKKITVAELSEITGIRSTTIHYRLANNKPLLKKPKYTKCTS